MFNDMHQIIIEEPSDSFRPSLNAYPHDFAAYLSLSARL